MEKIVVFTDHSEGSERCDMLHASLFLLFPECEIQIISKQSQCFGKVPLTQEAVVPKKWKNKNGNHLNEK